MEIVRPGCSRFRPPAAGNASNPSVRRKKGIRFSFWLCAAAALRPTAAIGQDSAKSMVRVGTAAFTDYHTQRPGVSRRITVADLPKPYSSPSVDNGPTLVSMPKGVYGG